MENDPLLFIDSVKKHDDLASSNQTIYDSRIKTRKEVAKHRLEDIKAMLYYRINVLAEIKTFNKLYEGIVTYVSIDGLRFKTATNDLLIPIKDIDDINILKI